MKYSYFHLLYQTYPSNFFDPKVNVFVRFSDIYVMCSDGSLEGELSPLNKSSLVQIPETARACDFSKLCTLVIV